MNAPCCTGETTEQKPPTAPLLILKPARAPLELLNEPLSSWGRHFLSKENLMRLKSGQPGEGLRLVPGEVSTWGSVAVLGYELTPTWVRVWVQLCLMSFRWPSVHKCLQVLSTHMCNFSTFGSVRGNRTHNAGTKASPNWPRGNAVQVMRHGVFIALQMIIQGLGLCAGKLQAFSPIPSQCACLLIPPVY